MTNEQYHIYVDNLITIKDFCADIINLIGTGQCKANERGDICIGCETELRLIDHETQHISKLIKQNMELYNETRSTHD